MRIGDKAKIDRRNREIVPIIRQNETIYIETEAVEHFDDFDKLVPQPIPPEIIRPGGVKELDLRNKAFMERMLEYAQLKTQYVIITSLSVTQGLAWDKVDMNDPRTWKFYEEELREFGLTDVEIGRVSQAVLRANCLDDTMIEQAKKDFLADQARLKG